ncbi:MAG: nucleoside deaminase, partial [Mesorhizobium sp.]
ALPEVERQRLETRIGRISARYDELSDAYQANKAANDIPLS